MRTLTLLVFCFPALANSFPSQAHLDHDWAEVRAQPNYIKLATGVFTATPVTHPWPVSVLSIGHTNASYQRYDGTPAYFHHGLDIRANAGARVTAAAGGKVVNIENYLPGQALYWEIAILDKEGFIWQYHHVEKSSIPTSVWNAFKTGGAVAEGDQLGTVCYWPVTTFGERFHHIHLNVLGSGKELLSPFSFLDPLKDNQPPSVDEIGLLQGGKRVAGTTVTGSYSLYAQVSDLILHPKFTVPPHVITASVDGEKAFTVWNFDTLPGGSDMKKFVNQFYIPSLACGDYSCRRPVIDLGFQTTGARIFPSNPGQHDISVTVRDFAGNESSKTFSWWVDWGT